ncbi:MAG TPA: hypothetical protein IAC34_03755 [Candidatus Coprenecus stercoripullorum]|nr:hypothetical protein [Candidatus Coprenecus stercoripullorum]
MKKISIIAAIAATSLMILSSCGAPRQIVADSQQQQQRKLFGETQEIPCADYDTEEYFAATGTYYGSSKNLSALQTAALNHAQQLVHNKLSHAYIGAVDNYFSAIGTNVGSDVDNKFEGAGTQIINDVVNETGATCVRFDAYPDEKGNVNCYVSVRVSKEELADRITDFVSEDEELNIRFKEHDFRERMKESFKLYKDNL